MPPIVQNVIDRWMKSAKGTGPGPMGRPMPNWLPKDSEYLNPEGTDIEMWLYTLPGQKGTRFGVVAFMGKQGKPFMNYYYTSEPQRARAIEQAVDGRKQYFSRKDKTREDKKQFRTDLLFGDILYTSWGYDQTNVDFYEVTDVVGPQMIKVRPVSGKVVREDSKGSYEMVVPAPGKFTGPEMRVKVQPGNTAKIEGHYAHKWEGKPVHQTGPYGGH